MFRNHVEIGCVRNSRPVTSELYGQKWMRFVFLAQLQFSNLIIEKDNEKDGELWTVKDRVMEMQVEERRLREFKIVVLNLDNNNTNCYVL